MLRKKGSGGFEYRQQREEPLARHLDYGEDEGSEMQVQVNEEELMTKHWLTRVCFLRFLGFLYLIAFLIALDQNEALLGEEGLTPSVNFMQRIMQRYTSSSSSLELQGFMQLPTLYWFFPPDKFHLNLLSWIGIVLSLMVIFLGAANIFVLFTMWIVYMSICNVGQTWYGFGWESQLLETGFLAIFMVPLFSLSKFPALTPTPFVCIWGYRWLLFRIMIGAGLIKIRGDQCWRDFTCMQYHYQTQPNPNPISPLMHSTPNIIHTIETLGNHVIELLIPWLVFLPRSFRVFSGLCQIFFQIVLIVSGNLAFLNWLTIAPALMYFDDFSYRWMFSKETKLRVLQAHRQYAIYVDNKENKTSILVKVNIYIRRFVSGTILLLLAKLSYPVVLNLMSSQQAMNSSFDAFRIVNTYGAFGSITKVRTEVILQGTLDSTITEQSEWKEFNFKCKPGDINRRPCVISPYHYRLDWLMWFAAFQNYHSCPWIVHLAVKLMRSDQLTSSLLAADGNPFSGGSSISNESNISSSDSSPPKFIRAMHYEYRYNMNWIPGHRGRGNSNDDSKNRDDNNAMGKRENEREKKDKDERQGWERGKWWDRKVIGEYMPPISLHDPSLHSFLEHHGWKK